MKRRMKSAEMRFIETTLVMSPPMLVCGFLMANHRGTLDGFFEGFAGGMILLPAWIPFLIFVVDPFFTFINKK